MKKRRISYRVVIIFLVMFLSLHLSVAQNVTGQNLKITGIKGLPFIMENNKVEYQPILISAALTSGNCSATVLVNGNATSILQFEKGENQLEIPVKKVNTPVEVEVIVKAKGMEDFKTLVKLKPVSKRTCYILPHSHTDIGYTQIQTEIEDKQVENLVKGMDIAKRTSGYPAGARFVWNVEVGWAADLFLNRMNESMKKDFFDAVSRGEIALNGMYLNELTGLCRPEELSRLFKFSTELGKKCNTTIDAAMTSDVPGQTWGTVTAMAQAGIKYFSTAPNYFDRVGDILVEWENKPFYWVSPSGREKVLVWVPYMGYALSHRIKKLTPSFVEEYSTLLDSTQYPFDITYLRWSGHGDNAEPDPEICEFVKEWKSRYTWPKFIISSTSEAFRAMEERYGDQLLQWKGDWTPYWEDGAASSAFETAMNRASSDRLSQAEALWAMKNPRKYPAGFFEEAWKKVLLYSEHTWGAWCSVSDPENQKTSEQWEIKQSYALDADKLSRRLLADAVKTGGDNPPENTIEVINTNSWPRSEIVLVPEALSGDCDQVTGSENTPVPSQRLSTGELAIQVIDLPPYSGRQYSLQKGSSYTVEKGVRTQGMSMENGLLRVEIDPQTGAISTLQVGSAKGVNLVGSESGYTVNEYVFLDSVKFDQIEKIKNVEVSVKEGGPLVASLLIESGAPGCNKLLREVKMFAGQQKVELTNILDKKRAKISVVPGDRNFSQRGGKESVNFAFPFNVSGGVVRIEVPYGIMQPEKDQIPSACKNWLTAGRWADVSNDESGVALVTLDAPLFEVGGITATMLGSQRNPKVWRKHIEPTQTLFSWAINNHWGTNYRAYQEGIITFRYALWPHGPFQAAENSKYAIGLSQPLLVVQAGTTLNLSGGIYPDQPEVIVTALKPCDNGSGRMVTLFNSGSVSVRTRLVDSEKTNSLFWESNTAEEKIKKIIQEIELPPWGVMLLRVE